MIRLHLGSRWSVRHVAMVACLLACACAGIVAGERQDGTKPGAGGTNASVRGRVAWLADAVDQQLDIKLVPELRERTLALVTSDGRILPLLEDVRGRSFRLDKRSAERDVELVVRRYQRTPARTGIADLTVSIPRDKKSNSCIGAPCAISPCSS